MQRLYRMGLLLVLVALAVPLGAQRPGQGRRMRALQKPQFVPAAQADFLKDSDRVVGVAGKGVAKAYSVPMIGWHHIIHDQLGDLPILPTW